MDEVSCQEIAELDLQDDQIYGPTNKIMVMMLRGLEEDWRQVVYVGLDPKLNKILLNEVIFNCQKVGAIVRGCTFDNGNITLLSELGVNALTCSMPNPQFEGKNIYFFPDPPHCLKLLRNHMLDYGIEIDNENGN